MMSIHPGTTAPPSLEAMIGFALRWLSHGGGPCSEISDRFGMTSLEFFTTILDHLDQYPPAPIHPEVLHRMKSVARKRLWLLS